MTRQEMESVLSEIDFEGWEFLVLYDGEGLYLQVRFEAPDLITGELEVQHGRKWRLSEFMTLSELVQTAFKAAMTAVEHEVRESFRFRGVSVFGPHLNVEKLVEFARQKENIDVRTGAWVAT